ncbi:hypothetical protein PHYSODRAFT_317228 [Phytophthora sojae]|uniref:Uncharacterized protein n=1 Tax=Phytophthora sojae (strain P6497) TaxID=1094619 RepID=G4ZX80_PHYSP|nr:hypothetical protein PHYSODRAFT_317228 [Phytophthora sojae]EGZ11797.1 hypothetical protein PHYSODRAFT_317228 [Phytophthora sojae]|eukprot:XP_009532130.1 hypothetical protein PHYSODRAFT_317228 [Phytophthora sojae]
MAGRVTSARRRMLKAWISIQAEYQGRYSDQRLQQLGNYMNELKVPPLAPPEAGVYENDVFFVRSWAAMCFMGVSALVQMVLILAILGLYLIAFPLPFGLLIAGPPFVLVIGVCFSYISGPRWRADPSLVPMLPFVYPLYILSFVSLTRWNQVISVAVLPIIQILAKNWINLVIFVVDVCNALYVSNVLQTPSSWASTAAVIVVDLGSLGYR